MTLSFLRGGGSAAVVTVAGPFPLPAGDGTGVNLQVPLTHGGYPQSRGVRGPRSARWCAAVLPVCRDLTAMQRCRCPGRAGSSPSGRRVLHPGASASLRVWHWVTRPMSVLQCQAVSAGAARRPVGRPRGRHQWSTGGPGHPTPCP